ncbi:hypothetical protein [Nostoc sp.]|uniref:hypothetical protein n=1 Tax=Nostoc sp. TaxID=1180 RepID=UPI002FF49102
MSNIKISDLHSNNINMFQDLSDNATKTVMGGSWLSDRLGINIKIGAPEDGVFPIKDFTI